MTHLATSGQPRPRDVVLVVDDGDTIADAQNAQKLQVPVVLQQVRHAGESLNHKPQEVTLPGSALCSAMMS